MVRVRRIELRSQVWKTCILTAVLHPRGVGIISFHLNHTLEVTERAIFVTIPRDHRWSLFISFMADVAQLVRALVCGTGGRGFEPHHSPQVKYPTLVVGYFTWDDEGSHPRLGPRVR